MAKTKKSWREKLADAKGCPKVAKIEGKLTKRWGEGTFVIPAPLEVDAAMKKIRAGKLTGRQSGRPSPDAANISTSMDSGGLAKSTIRADTAWPSGIAALPTQAVSQSMKITGS